MRLSQQQRGAATYGPIRAARARWLGALAPRAVNQYALFRSATLANGAGQVVAGTEARDHLILVPLRGLQVYFYMRAFYRACIIIGCTSGTCARGREWCSGWLSPGSVVGFDDGVKAS